MFKSLSCNWGEFHYIVALLKHEERPWTDYNAATAVFKSPCRCS